MNDTQTPAAAEFARPSWLREIPADEYHQATKNNRYLTSHRLAVFRKDPLEYKRRCDGVIVDADTAAFTLGRAAHVLVLEGEKRFADEFDVCDGPENPKTGKPFGRETKAYAEWAATCKRPVVSTADKALLDSLRAAVHAHPVAKTLLSEPGAFAEGTVRTSWNGVSVQARPDWFNPSTGTLLDLKTCSDVDRFRFDVRDFGYLYQLAFYRKCLALAGYEGEVHCWIVAVEKKEPFRVAVLRVTEPTVDDHNLQHFVSEGVRDDNDAMVDELKACRESDNWPTRYEEAIIV